MVANKVSNLEQLCRHAIRFAQGESPSVLAREIQNLKPALTCGGMIIVSLLMLVVNVERQNIEKCKFAIKRIKSHMNCKEFSDDEKFLIRILCNRYLFRLIEHRPDFDLETDSVEGPIRVQRVRDFVFDMIGAMDPGLIGAIKRTL